MPSKRLDQNFVTGPGTVRRIVALAGLGPGDVVLEVGLVMVQAEATERSCAAPEWTRAPGASPLTVAEFTRIAPGRASKPAAPPARLTHMRQKRHLIHRYLRTRRWRAALRVARVLAGLAAAFFGVAVFLASPVSTATGEAFRHSQSMVITSCSFALVVVGFVAMVGPDKINEIATRNRR